MSDPHRCVVRLGLVITAVAFLGHGAARAAGPKYYLYDSAGVRVAVLDGMVSAPGVVFAFAGPSCPSGSLVANGAAVSRTAYPELFEATGRGQLHGAGDGSTTFNLPDLRGQFVRGTMGFTTKTFAAADVNAATDTIVLQGQGEAGKHNLNRSGFPIRFATVGSATLPGGLAAGTTYWAIYVSPRAFKVATSEPNAINGVAVDITSAGSGVVMAWADPEPGARTRGAPGASYGDAVGSVETDAFQGHFHKLFNGNYGQCCLALTAGDGNQFPAPSNMLLVRDPIADLSNNGAPRTASETRPRNIGLLYCIQY